MKRLLYLLVFITTVSVFSACSTRDELEEISIETPQSATELTEDKKTPTPTDSTQPARDPIPSKSPF